MENLIVLGFKGIGWAFVNLGRIALPLMVGSACFYLYAFVRNAMWALTWDSKHKERVQASKAEPKSKPPTKPKAKKKSPPKAPSEPSRAVVSDYADEYKLPQLPFS